MDMTSLADQEVFRLWAASMRELTRRELIRSANNPTGDYGEVLVARRLGLQLVGSSTAAYDAVAPDGTRYQIKARRLQNAKTSRQLGAIRNLDQGGFDHLVVVLFDGDFGLTEMWRLPIDLVREHAVYRKHVNAHILHARGPVLADARAERLHRSGQGLDAPGSLPPVEHVGDKRAGVADVPFTGVLGDLARHGIDGHIDLASLLEEAFHRRFGYAIGGSPWRTSALHEAGVFRRGRSMTKRPGGTPTAALARALVDALDMEADGE